VGISSAVGPVIGSDCFSKGLFEYFCFLFAASIKVSYNFNGDPYPLHYPLLDVSQFQVGRMCYRKSEMNIKYFGIDNLREGLLMYHRMLFVRDYTAISTAV
jgi:hypothetical protein